MSRQLKLSVIIAFLVSISAWMMPTTASAQGNMPMLFALPVGSYIPHMSYETRFAVEQAVSNQAAQLESFAQGVRLGFPIWQNDEDEISFAGKFRAKLFETNAVLPNTGEPFPKRLWNISFGPNYRHRFGNRWVLGFSALMGSASDVPFSQYDVLDINANVFLKIPSGERNAWVFLINYASNREFLRHYPIPGFGFLLASKKEIRAFFGIPFFMQLMPDGPISFRASYIPIVTIDSVLSAKPAKSLELFIGYQWRNERYMRADRIDRDDRLYYYEMLAKAGCVVKPARWAKLILEGGYSFRRKYFEGERFYDDSFNRVSIRPGPYASMNLELMLGRPPSTDSSRRTRR